MATVNENVSSTISPEAVDLLGCFYDGIDKLVYNFAEEMARERLGHSPVSGPIHIESEDVRRAAELVINGIKKMVESKEAPVELGAAVGNMRQCFEGRARSSK